MKIMDVFKKRLDHVFITDRRRDRLSSLSLVANLSQLLLTFFLVYNIVAKRSRTGGRSINFPFGEDF